MSLNRNLFVVAVGIWLLVPCAGMAEGFRYRNILGPQLWSAFRATNYNPVTGDYMTIPDFVGPTGQLSTSPSTPEVLVEGWALPDETNVLHAPSSDAAHSSSFDATEMASVDHQAYAETTWHSDGEIPAQPDDPTLSAHEPTFGTIPDDHASPRTYGSVEGLILWRSNQSLDQALVQNRTTGETLLSVGNLDFNASGGVRAGFGVRTCTGIAWEFNYLGLFDQSTSAFMGLADELALPGALGVAVNDSVVTDQVAVRYASSLNSAEVDRVTCRYSCVCPTHCRSLEWLYGFRYLNLSERFSIAGADLGGSTSVYRIHTNNNLFGAQVGSRLQRRYKQLSWEAIGKVGIFGNAANQFGDSIVDLSGDPIRPTRSANSGQVAFVGDLNLTGICPINHVWGLRAGYNLIWIEGVALAPNQLDFTNTSTSGTRLSTNGGVFLHGLNVGLEARW